MTSAPENIHPIFDRILSRRDKETKLRQRARVVWLYGLSGSGKSTLAAGLERRLHADGFTTHLLDGDNVRTGFNRDLGFSDADRGENIRRVAEVSRLFVQAGIIVINAFITPTRALRELARGIIGADDFIEVYVEASWETCARRDPKGLYAGAGRGEVRQFTGRDAPFEPPEKAPLVLNTDRESVGQSLEHLYAFVSPRLRPPAG
jgi:adenylylsulfate kinase